MKTKQYYSPEQIDRFEKIRKLLDGYNRALQRGEKIGSPFISFEDRLAYSEYFEYLKQNQKQAV